MSVKDIHGLPVGLEESSEESYHINTNHVLFLGEYEVFDRSYCWLCSCETELYAACWWPGHEQSRTVCT